MVYEDSIQQKKGKSPSQLKLARMFSAVGSSSHSRYRSQYQLAYLGKISNIAQNKPSDHVINNCIDKLLQESTSKPQPVILKLNTFQSISLLDSDKERSLLASYVYSEICSCAVSTQNPTCIGVLTGPGVNLLDDVPPSFTCTVLEAPSPDQALLVCQQIGELSLDAITVPVYHCCS